MKIVKLTTTLIFMTALSLLSFGHVFAGTEDLDGDCSNNWYITYSLELRPGYWIPGEHNYSYKLAMLDENGETIEDEYSIIFNVSENVQLYDGQVMLRYFALTTFPRQYNPTPPPLYIWHFLYEINPSQDTVFQVAWVAFDVNRKQASEDLAASELSAELRWDEGDWITLSPGPLVNGCSFVDDDYLFFRHWGKPNK